MWMIDMIVFGVLYASLVVLILSPILFWLVDLVDYVVKDVTNGDKVNYLRNNYRVPLMRKLGFKFRYYSPEVIEDDMFTVVSFLVTHSTSLAACSYFLISYSVEGTLPYELLSAFVTMITPYSTWVLIPVGYIVVRKLLQKTYSMIKKVNSLPDTSVDKQQ